MGFSLKTRTESRLLSSPCSAATPPSTTPPPPPLLPYIAPPGLPGSIITGGGEAAPTSRRHRQQEEPSREGGRRGAGSVRPERLRGRERPARQSVSQSVRRERERGRHRTGGREGRTQRTGEYALLLPYWRRRTRKERRTPAEDFLPARMAWGRVGE